jgi:hypothetical protein
MPIKRLNSACEVINEVTVKLSAVVLAPVVVSAMRRVINDSDSEQETKPESNY